MPLNYSYYTKQPRKSQFVSPFFTPFSLQYTAICAIIRI
nr:MAG TPA: hypothetical protein [Caudoviricetes sp.]